MKKLFLSFGLLLAFVACEKNTDDNSCVDPALIDAQAICPAVEDPVCGCDGKTYSNACVAESQGGVTSYTQGICGCTYKYSGTVADYTGLDGCGLMIDLDNGKRLEPLRVPSNFTLIAGQRVELDYRVFTTHGSFCMAGELADIICIREKPCLPIITDFQTWTSGFKDDVYIKEASLFGSCLNITYSHGGGCVENHEFELRLMPVHCPTPPSPPVVELVHEAHGDRCEALIYGAKSFDISELQVASQKTVEFYLVDPTSNYNQKFTYEY